MQQARARDYARGAITAFPPCAFGLPSSSYLASACARAVSPWQACSCCHIRRGLALDRLGWIGVAAVVMGCGAPMVLLVNAGLLFAFINAGFWPNVRFLGRTGHAGMAEG